MKSSAMRYFATVCVFILLFVLASDYAVIGRIIIAISIFSFSREIVEALAWMLSRGWKHDKSERLFDDADVR